MDDTERRAEDLKAHGEGATQVAALIGLTGTTSNEPGEAAKAVEAFGTIQEAVAKKMGQPVDEADLQIRTAKFAEMVARLHEENPAPLTSALLTDVDWRRGAVGVKAWDATARKQFMELLGEEGIIPPPSVNPTAMPSAPVAPK